jgi:hypothetical protein
MCSTARYKVDAGLPTRTAVRFLLVNSPPGGEAVPWDELTAAV